MTKVIKLIRLLSGEDLLAEFKIDNGDIVLTNPVQIMVVPGSDRTKPQVGFSPWIQFTTSKTMRMHPAHVITVVDPVPQFVEQYTAMFSGIVMPENRLILPS